MRAPGGMMPNPNQMAMRRDINMLRPPGMDSSVQSPYGGRVYTGTVVNPNSGQGMSGPGFPPSAPSNAGLGQSPMPQGMPPLPRGAPPAWGVNGQPPGMGGGTGFGGGLFGGLFRRLMQNPQMQQGAWGQLRGALGPMLQQFRQFRPGGGSSG